MVGLVHRRRGKLSITRLELNDVPDFLRLQDLLAAHHLSLTKSIYPKAGFRDWQLCLHGDVNIIDAPEGRESQVRRIVQREWAGRLYILKAMCHRFGRESSLVGYLMYEVHGSPLPEAVGTTPTPAAPPPPQNQQRRRRQAAAPWVHILQVFVHPAHRRRGCGGRLFARMLALLRPEERRDIRLEVLDLNSLALAWYQSLGFEAAGINPKFLGDKDRAHVIVYQEMQRLRAEPDVAGEPSAKPLPAREPPKLFKTEVLQENILVKYPNRSGHYEVKIVGYDKANQWHCVGRSLGDGEELWENIDLNTFYRDGHVQFKRCLSLILRDSMLMKRAIAEQRKRKRKMFESAGMMTIQTRSKRKCCLGYSPAPL